MSALQEAHLGTTSIERFRTVLSDPLIVHPRAAKTVARPSRPVMAGSAL
jgi:hypothetical protein